MYTTLTTLTTTTTTATNSNYNNNRAERATRRMRYTLRIRRCCAPTVFGLTHFSVTQNNHLQNHAALTVHEGDSQHRRQQRRRLARDRKGTSFGRGIVKCVWRQQLSLINLWNYMKLNVACWQQVDRDLAQIQFKNDAIGGTMFDS